MNPRPSRWHSVGRIVALVFFIVVAALVATRLRAIDWNQVAASLQAYERRTLLLAALLAAASYAVYGCFDLLGRLYTGHRVGARRVMAIAFVSYAFNLNLGAMVGGVGFRYRLYSRHGLDTPRIARILGLSLATNWLGYLTLAGLVFAMRSLPLPPEFAIGAGTLQGIGIALLVLAIAYLGLCAMPRRRSVHIRGAEIQLPHLRMGVTQLGLSMVNWTLIASLIWVLLGRQVPFGVVLAVLLVSSIATVISRIPGGLGVLEAVFLAFLGGEVPESELLAALIAYRAIYFLAPLLIGTVIYLVLEARARRREPAPAAVPAGRPAPQ